MSFKNKPDKSLPELTSQRRLRESLALEGGPGSGPQGGRHPKSNVTGKGKAAISSKAAKTAKALHSTGYHKVQTKPDGVTVFKAKGEFAGNDYFEVKPDGSWKHEPADSGIRGGSGKTIKDLRHYINYTSDVSD